MKSQLKSLWNFQSFILLIMAISMFNNLEHGAAIYNELSDSDSILQSYIVVIVVDLTVMALVWKGKREAIYFAWILFAINLLFWDFPAVVYQLWVFNLADNPTAYIALIKQLVGMIIWSGVFAYSVHRFSRLYGEELKSSAKVKDKVADLSAQLLQLQEDLQGKDSQLEQAIREIEQAKEACKLKEDKVTELTRKAMERESQLTETSKKAEELEQWKKRELEKRTCTCGYLAKNSHDLAGHKKSCSVVHIGKLVPA